MDVINDKRREDRARRQLKAVDCALRKDRARSLTLDHQGGYMVVDPFKNYVIRGSRYDWNLDDVLAWLAS
jgi:hypothetical protein